MEPNEKICVITDFINHLINKIDYEILCILQKNYDVEKELLNEQESKEVRHLLYAKDKLIYYLIEDGPLDDYVSEED